MKYSDESEVRLLEYLDQVFDERPATEATRVTTGRNGGTPETTVRGNGATRPAVILAERSELNSVAMARFPTAVARSSVVVKPRPIAVATLGVSSKIDFRNALTVKPVRAFTRLPLDIIIPPVQVPNRPSPISLRGDALYLVPDEANSVIYYLCGTPRLLDLSIQINLDANGKTLGGSATLLIALQADIAATDSDLQKDATSAVHAAGYPVKAWTLRALTLSRVTPVIELPDGHHAVPPTVTGNADAATATFLVSLSPLAAQIWHRAYVDENFALPGLCQVTSMFTVQDNRARPVTKTLLHSVALSVLAAKAGGSSLRVVNAEQSVNTTLVVDADPIIENVVVEMHASSGGAKTEVFGAAGGQLSVPVTSPNLATEQVRWSATVSYGVSSWPPIRTGGVLSSATGWSALIVPSSWRREVRFTAVLLDASGAALRGSETEDRVTGTIDFNADFLIGQTGLQNSFETQSQVIITTTLPQPPGAAPGRLKLTVFALRGGRDSMLVREIATEENWVLARIYANGRIEIVTNLTPGSESTREEIVRVLRDVSADAQPSAWPSIEAYVDPETNRVAFRLNSGRNPYWAIEVATEPGLLLPEMAGERNSNNYFSSLEGENARLKSGEHFQFSDARWRRWAPSRKFYYRLWTSSDPARWQDPETTVLDAVVDEAPFISW